VEVASVELTARVLNATLGELAVVLSRDRRRATLADADAIVRHMIESLRPQPRSHDEAAAAAPGPSRSAPRCGAG
jgi:predicted metal-dependent peptidase